MDPVRLAHELEIAREVQARLLPQVAPRLAGLALAATCIQARAVGGDYYDFLDVGPDRLGFVLADVSGKGIHAALRMANLHAHVRSQVINAPQDPLRVLRMVNRMLCESSEPGQFATMFFGVFTAQTRRLAYINCGHNPPLCLRNEGSVEWLAPTATVLGAFSEWECALGRTTLAPGDLFVAYSDGITEAMHDGEPFGEKRLLDVVSECQSLAPETIVAELVRRVEAYCGGRPDDDLTLLIARADRD